MAVHSYTVAFIAAACGLIFYGLLIGWRGQETLPAIRAALHNGSAPLKGYSRVLHHREFMMFIAAFTLTSMLASLIWVLLPVYSNIQFGVPENLYGFIPTTNALMVVTLQYLVTQVTKKHPPLRMLTLGTVFYAAATT